MNLQPEEIKTFFNNWLGFLTFVNDKYKLVKGFDHPKHPTDTKIKHVFKIKTKLWENVDIIDEYIDSIWDLPASDIKILKGWKRKISGTFLIVRHLKKYSVFINEEQEQLYGVIGISNPIPEVFPSYALPRMVETTLLPFNDRIIYDSMFGTYNIQFGSNMRKSFNTLYSEIKREKGIISTLNENIK